MKLLAMLLICAVAVGLPACRQATKVLGPREDVPNLIAGTGTILPRQAECSSWFLRADSGTLYELAQLDAEFQHVDLRVRFTARERNDLASVCMRGAKVEITWMTRF
jgi:hypothetical protein